jgi:hypothetical protein
MSDLLLLGDQFTYHLYRDAVDMRKSFDGLCALVRNRLDMSVDHGKIFIFLNKRRSHLKVLLHEDGGFSMFYRRLHEGSFELPDVDMTKPSVPISPLVMMSLLKGLKLLRNKNDDGYQHNGLRC